MINCITTANLPASNRLAGNNRGFTLIELLITITILAILAAIVIPSYNAQMHKTRRSDAVTTLLQIAQDLERCRSDTNAYDNAACTDYTGPANSQQGFYTITAAQAALTFTITAVPRAGTPQEDDSHCAQFTIDQTGLKTAQDLTPIDTTTDCWQ